jgi:hypothetical protein
MSHACLASPLTHIGSATKVSTDDQTYFRPISPLLMRSIFPQARMYSLMIYWRMQRARALSGCMACGLIGKRLPFGRRSSGSPIYAAWMILSLAVDS